MKGKREKMRQKGKRKPVVGLKTIDGRELLKKMIAICVTDSSLLVVKDRAQSENNNNRFGRFELFCCSEKKNLSEIHVVRGCFRGSD